MDCFPVRIVLEISEEVLQAVLLDKNPLRLWRFTKSKKRINESSNQRFVLFYTKRYCGMQLLYHYRSHSIDKNNRPDLTPLYKSSETVGKVLKKGDIVIYESTVYPG
jgi:UDP-N-acetyl-D-galactosamine dehydrogenase